MDDPTIPAAGETKPAESETKPAGTETAAAAPETPAPETSSQAGPQQGAVPAATPAPAASEPVRQIVVVTPEVQDAIKTLVEAEVTAAVDNAKRDLDALEASFDQKIEAAKLDILAHLTPLITAATKAPTPIAAVAQPAAGNLAVGAPVKVWADPEHKAFRLGEIAAIHDGAHAFDVKLDDGTVTKVNADGLEYDDRK
jgi:hypothetical protein